nr:leucine-rich repeat domain-containing protein [Oscillospiraceae bacterium]
MDDFNSTQNNGPEEETRIEEKKAAAKPSFNFKKLLPIIVIAAAIVIVVVTAILIGTGNDDKSDEHVHESGNPVIENEVAATCLSDGSYDEIIYCTLCNETLSSVPNVIPKSEHTDNGEGVCTACQTAFKPNSKLTYRIYESEGYAEVKGYSGQSTVVLIAETYEGYPVKAIGYRAFIDNKSITKVIIPEGITQIKDEAFGRCKKLENPVLPKSLVTLGKGSFKECDAITSLRISGNIKIINDYAFYDCNNLKYVILGEGVETINQSAFDSCGKLTYIVLPKSLQSINARAFLECDNQKRIYYLGTPDDFYGIDIAFWNTCINESTWYYYSESQPEYHELLKYWHYNDEGKIAVWN